MGMCLIIIIVLRWYGQMISQEGRFVISKELWYRRTDAGRLDVFRGLIPYTF